MTPDSPTPHDNEQRRIDELESQVRELSGLVEILLSKPENKQAAEDAGRRGRKRRAARPKAPLMGTVREAVGHALGGVEGESLESRIGGIWLGRVVAVVFMTAFVLGALLTLQDDRLGAWWKVGIGYAISVAAIAYGLYRRKDASLFPQTFLGSGLAAVYFTTYAAFFIDTAQVMDAPHIAIAVLTGSLVAVAAIAHFRRSEAAAGIALFLIYYTVVLSLSNSLDQDNILYALITCSLVALIALLFHLTHRWMFFSWAALIATQITYIYFFIAKPPSLDVTDAQYFWVSNAFLTLIFCVFSVACVTDAHRTGEYRRTVAPMSGVNSFIYLVLTWIAVRGMYPEWEWAFRFGQTGMFVVFMAYAHFAGQPRNYLFQIFAAKAFIVFTLALQSYLSHEWLVIAMAIESLALGLSYLRSRLVIFKVLAQGLLLATLGYCLYLIQESSRIDVIGYVVPAKWFSAVGASLVWCIVAWFYHYYVKPVPRAQLNQKGQWFLAGSRVDLSGWGMALFHGFAASVALMALTVFDLGSDVRMPFLLAGEGIAMALVGVILGVPQVEVAAVLLLFASHACYHSFLLMGVPGFESQENFLAYALIVTIITLFGGVLWERYLNRIQGGTQWEHDAMAAIPFLAAALMLFTIAEQRMPPGYSSVAMLAFALIMLLGSAVTGLVGTRSGGVLTLALASWSYLSYLAKPEPAGVDSHGFLINLTAALLCYAASERACIQWERNRGRSGPPARLLRTAIVALATITGIIGLWRWAPSDTLTLYWLGHAMGAMILGVIFWERRYRWAALFIYIVFVVGRAMVHDLSRLELLPRFLSFAALTVPGILIWWGYSEYRARNLQRLREQRAIQQAIGEPDAQDAPQS